MSIRVIGAGLPRTGTMSLKAAVTRLGFDPCYHMIDLLGNPKQVHYWEAASRGELGPLEELFSDWQATVDYPGCRYYRELMEIYPDARVVLSIRDAESWYESVHGTINQVQLRVFDENGQPRTAPSPTDEPSPMLRVMQLLRHDMWQTDFEGRFDDREFMIEYFNRYNAEVQEYVPPERLLVFRATQGWEPLCDFLGVPVPQNESYPRLNDREEFMSRLNSGIVDK